MSEEVNAIIDNLCDRLGTSAKFLIPELAKLNIATNITVIIICLIVGGILFKVIPTVWKYDQKNRGNWNETFWIVFPGVVGLITAVAFVNSVYELIGWLVSPTAKAVMIILSMLR